MYNTPQERATLSIRLKSALKAKGIKPSPTLVSQRFNEFSGNAVTPHTVRNWLLGKALPQYDKLLALGKWLEVSPSELRYGPVVGKKLVLVSTVGEIEINQIDRKFFDSYLNLPFEKQLIIRDIVDTYVEVHQA